MKQKSRYMVATACFVCATLFLTTIIVYRYIFANKRIFVVVDSGFSHELKLLIERAIHKTISSCDQHGAAHKPYLTPDSSLLYTTLYEQFPVIADIDLYRCAPGTLVVRLRSQKPILLLNDDWVVTKQQDIVKKELFVASELGNIPNIVHTNKGAVSAASGTQLAGHMRFKDAMQGLIPHAPYIAGTLCPEYDVVWNDGCCIYLYDRSLPNDQDHHKFAVCATTESLLDCSLLKLSTHLKDELKTLGKFDVIKKKDGRKCRKQWIADIRFDKQIILFQEDLPLKTVRG